MSMITDWITAVSTGVSATAIGLLWMQTRLFRQQVSEDHERSRRETAIKLMLDWTEHLQQETSSARKLAEELTDQQCIDLFGTKPLDLPLKLKALVTTCLSRSEAGVPKEENGLIRLEEPQVALIRWQVIRYLNTLEVIMAARRHNVADREMIAEQFGYLIDPAKGHNALEKFRNASGGRVGFPAIADFADELKRTREHVGPSKPKLS